MLNLYKCFMITFVVVVVTPKNVLAVVHFYTDPLAIHLSEVGIAPCTITPALAVQFE